MFGSAMGVLEPSWAVDRIGTVMKVADPPLYPHFAFSFRGYTGINKSVMDMRFRTLDTQSIKGSIRD